jgi:cytochrome c oxidase assembly protein subunit 15
LVKSRIISLCALGATFFALCVIALGAFTRLIDAGLGCPDWPGCYGHLLAYWATYKAWAEMIHRYFAGSLSVLILGISVLVLFTKELRVRSNVLLIIGLLILVIYQILLGQWTVTLKLLPIVVTQHLLGGFLILSLLWLAYLNNDAKLRRRLQHTQAHALLPWAILGVVFLILQISLGAWTSTNYASLSCPDFPLCDNAHPQMSFYFKAAFNPFSAIGLNYEGGVLPEVYRQTIQMTHRIGALFLTIYLFVFFIFSMPILKKSIELLKSVYIVIALLAIQLCIGIANVIFKLPLVTAISHNLVAVLLLLAMITLAYKLALTRRVR